MTEALKIALDALDEIALAGMSGTGMESEEAMRDWHARQAWKFIGIAARAKEAASAALSGVAAPAILPFAIQDDEMAALRRFYETTDDGEDYDVPKEMMQRLALIGLVRRTSGSRYELTDFGSAVINGDFSQCSGVAAPAGADIDAKLEQLIEESDGQWREDVFLIEASPLWELLRQAAALSGAPAVAVAEPLTEDRLPERLPVARIIELLEQAHIVTDENQYRNGRHFYRSLGHTTNVCEHDLIAFARGVESAHGIGSPSAKEDGQHG